MYDVVIRYSYAATGLLILYLLSVRSLVNDILVGSLPGKYGKADKKAACIRESHRFIERVTQKYIGQFVTEKYRGDYHFYMFLKAGLVAYYLLSLLALLVLAAAGQEHAAQLLYKVFLWADAAMALFFITRYDLNRRCKYTRDK